MSFHPFGATIGNLTPPLTVANGGTGDTTLTTFALLAGGTTATGAVQSLAGVGTTGQALASNGAGALPTFQTLPPAGGGTGSTTFFSWVPGDLSLLLANMSDLAFAQSTNITTAGTIYIFKIPIRAAVTITNVVWNVTTAGNNTGGSTGTFSGLYNSSGTLLSGSADAAALFTSTGLATVPLTTPQALSAGTFVWAALVTNLGTTQPTLARAAGSSAAYNAGLTAATFRLAVNGLTQTSLPTLTPASNTNTNSLFFWVGLS